MTGVLFACGDDGAPEPPEGGYSLAIEVRDSGSDQIDVTGTTNLPEGTEVTVVAGRMFLNPGADPTNPRGAELARSTALVHGGAYSVTLTLDSTTLLLGLDLPGESIEVVSPNVTVCSSVATGTDFDGDPRQPNGAVREQIGGNGEALEGSQNAFTFGSGTDDPSVWLETSTAIEHGSPQQEIEREQASAPRVEVIDAFCLT